MKMLDLRWVCLFCRLTRDVTEQEKTEKRSALDDS